jgi:DNA mismatch repair protein MutL
MISKAINDAYNRFIPHSMFPAYILNLEVDPTSVDVNVHPRKLEVRFENEQNIFKSVYYAIEEKLNNVSLIQTPLTSPLLREETKQPTSLNQHLLEKKTNDSFPLLDKEEKQKENNQKYYT